MYIFFPGKPLEPFVKAMYGKLEPFVEVLNCQVLSSSETSNLVFRLSMYLDTVPPKRKYTLLSSTQNGKRPDEK